MSITVTVPINSLYRSAVADFFQALGCTIEPTDGERRGAPLYRLTFPEGTRRELASTIQEPHFRLRLPDGRTLLEEVPAQGPACSFVFASAEERQE